jgi:hypothetical protein
MFYEEPKGKKKNPYMVYEKMTTIHYFLLIFPEITLIKFFQ